MVPGSCSLVLDRRSVVSRTVPAPPSYLLMQATLKLSSETSVSPAIRKSRKSEAGSLGSRPLGKATRGSILHSCEEPGKAGVGRAWMKSEGECCLHNGFWSRWVAFTSSIPSLLLNTWSGITCAPQPTKPQGHLESHGSGQSQQRLGCF